jgi:hypothetical protein
MSDIKESIANDDKANSPVAIPSLNLDKLNRQEQANVKTVETKSDVFEYNLKSDKNKNMVDEVMDFSDTYEYV